MEVNSPQPEHAQLHGNIQPKTFGAGLKNHQTLFSRSVMDSGAGNSKNSVLKGIVFNMDENRQSMPGKGDEMIRTLTCPPMSTNVPNSSRRRPSSAGGNNDEEARKTDEVAQGSGGVDRNSGGNVSSSIVRTSTPDSQLIPSPPLSPDPQCHQNSYECEPVGEIVVTPSWTPGMSSKRYRYATHGFLSQYRLMGYGGGALSESRSKKFGTGSTSIGGSATVARRSVKYGKPSYGSGGSDAEKVYRTRRVVKNSSSGTQEGDELAGSVALATNTGARRVNRKSKKTFAHHQSSSSPLASAKDVHSAPTYIPNMSWEKLPDYSPPLSTLPSNSNNKCLKVEWKGSSMDLSNDPLKHKLHPAELVLAQTLRLPCDLYLDSKRRLFCEKVNRLKQGMPFRRTDAQKACRIDVNKASRLFAAYEKIGWLDDDNFTRFL